MKRKLMIILLTAALTVAMMPATAFAAKATFAVQGQSDETTISLTWTKAAKATKATRYKVYYKKLGAKKFKQTKAIKARKLTLKKLAENTDYRIYVAAVNSTTRSNSKSKTNAKATSKCKSNTKTYTKVIAKTPRITVKTAGQETITFSVTPCMLTRDENQQYTVSSIVESQGSKLTFEIPCATESQNSTETASAIEIPCAIETPSAIETPLLTWAKAADKGYSVKKKARYTGLQSDEALKTLADAGITEMYWQFDLVNASDGSVAIDCNLVDQDGRDILAVINDLGFITINDPGCCAIADSAEVGEAFTPLAPDSAIADGGTYYYGIYIAGR